MDSAVMAAVDSLLGVSDTLAAVERLQTHADTLRPSLSITQALDRLILPDDAFPPVASSLDSLRASPTLPAPPSGRCWILSSQMGRDEGDDLPFWMGIQVALRTPLAWRRWLGHWERGARQSMAKTPSGILSSSEATVGGDLALGAWRTGLLAWSGVDQQGRVDVAAAGFFQRLDSFRWGNVSVGPEWRYSRSHARWLGGSLRWEEPHGVVVFGLARWRREPRLDFQSGLVRYRVEANRRQLLGSLSWMGSWGAWRCGPLVEVDARTSSGEDFWEDSTGVWRRTRAELVSAAGVEVALSGGKTWVVRLRPSWVVSRMDQTVGAGNVEENDGLRAALDGVLVF